MLELEECKVDLIYYKDLTSKDVLIKTNLEVEIAKSNERVDLIKKQSDNVFRDMFKKVFESFVDKQGMRLKNNKNDLPDLIVNHDHYYKLARTAFNNAMDKLIKQDDKENKFYKLKDQLRVIDTDTRNLLNNNRILESKNQEILSLNVNKDIILQQEKSKNAILSKEAARADEYQKQMTMLKHASKENETLREFLKLEQMRNEALHKQILMFEEMGDG